MTMASLPAGHEIASPPRNRVWLAFQRCYKRDGDQMGYDRLLGVVVADDAASALRAVPEIVLYSDPDGGDFSLTLCGEIAPGQALPVFFRADR